MYIQTGYSNQRIIENNLAQNAGNECVHGYSLLLKSLQDGRSCLNNGKQNYCKTRYCQQTGRFLDLCGCQRARIEKIDDGFRKHAHTNRTGKTDQKCKAKAEITLAPDHLLIADSPCCRDCRNKTHGNRKRQCSWNIDQTDDKTGKKAIKWASLFKRQSGNHHSVHQHGGIDELGQRNDAR